MATVTIEVDNDRVANALAMWFEADAVEVFKASRYGQVLENDMDIYLSDFADVTFDRVDRDVEHFVELTVGR